MARNERSAGFVVFRSAGDQKREYLLLDYGRHWDFPKGHVEKGETDLAAALRELREETGLSGVKPIPGFRHEIVYYFRDRKKGLIRKTVVFYLGQTDVGDDGIVVSHEHEGFAFLPYEQAMDRVTFANARQLLREAEKGAARGDAGEPGDNLSAPTGGR